MSKIDILRESNNKVCKDTTLSLLSDLLLKKLDNVLDYNESEVYYKGDLIYRFVNGRHEILEALEDNINGPFNYDQWAELTLNMSALANGRSDFDELLYFDVIYHEALEDGDNRVDLSSIENLREVNTNAILMHSVRGIIPRSEFVIDEISQEIKLTGWDLDAGESLRCLIFKFGKPSKERKGYSNTFEQSISISDNIRGNEYRLSIPSFDITKDKIIAIHSLDGILKETDEYTFTSEKIVLNKPLIEGQYVSILVFQQRPGDGYNNCVYGVYKFDKPELSNRAFIPIPGFAKGRDKLLVFDRVNGYTGEHLYDISENGKEIIFKELKFMINEELIFVALTESNNLYLPDDFLDLNHFSYNVRGHLSPLLGEVLLSINNPETTIDIPEGAFLNNGYSVKTEVIESTGDVGSIIIKNKTRESFTIEMTGISSKSKIQYTIIPAN